MNRKTFYWKLRDAELPLGERTLIMGILNLTPDSFSDGGMFNDPDRAYARALELEEQGADIIDIGAESTRPGSARISADEEWQRLVPVLKRLRGNLGVPLSIDTYKSETAARAMDYGVQIVNDPSGLTFDANVAKATANANAGLILNHMRGTPESWAKLAPLPDAPGTVARELEATVSRARRSGVEQNRIVVDPGIGFGKRGEQNAEILAHLGELARLDLPIMVGPSRKAFLRQKTEEETIYATVAAVAAAILKGAHIVRVHDVKEVRAAVLVADEIARAAGEHRVQTERSAARPNPPADRTIQRGFVEDTARPARPPLAARTEREAPPPQTYRPAASQTPGTDERPPREFGGKPAFDRGERRGPGREDRGDRGFTPGRTGPPRDRGFERTRTGPPRDREFRGGDSDRGRGARPGAGRPAGARPGGSRPAGSRPAGSRPADGRPGNDRGRDSGSGGYPPRRDDARAGNRGGDRPRGDRFQGGQRGGSDRPDNRAPGGREGGGNRGPGGFSRRGEGESGPPRGDKPRRDQQGGPGGNDRGPRPPAKRIFRKRP